MTALRATAYVDFVHGLIAARISRDLKQPDEHVKNLRAAVDARLRIAAFASSPVVHAVAEMWKPGINGNDAFKAFVTAVRAESSSGKIAAGDLDLLFAADAPGNSISEARASVTPSKIILP